MEYQIIGLPLAVHIVELLMKDHPISHKNVVLQDRWSLVTGSVIHVLKCRSFCQKWVVVQGRWSHGSGLTRQVLCSNMP